MSLPLRLLQVEDSESDAALVRRFLEQAGYDVTWECVETSPQMGAALAQGHAWDVIIADYRLPQFDAPSALRILQESGRDIPFIVVSGTIGEDVAVKMLKSGAHDYLMKDKLTRLASAVQREIAEVHSRQARRQTEESLRESSQRLALAFAAANLGIWEWDLVTNNVTWSTECLEILSEGGYLGKLESLTTVVHPDDLPAVMEAASRAMTERASFSAEFRVIRGGGEVAWVSNLGAATYADDGRPLRLRGIVQDITERRRSEAALLESEQRWQFALEGSGDGVWDWNGETNRCYYSRQWKAMIGYGEQEIGDLPAEFEDRIHPDDRERVLSEIDKHYSGESQSYVAEYRLRCKDGTYKWILGRGRVIARTADGRVSRAIGTHADLTALKANEAERENLRAQFHQAQKMESIGRLAGGVAHDFNNFLTVINGYSALLLGQMEPDDRKRESVEQIERAGQRATDMVRQLLAFSRQQESYRDVVDLNQVVQDMGKTLVRLLGDQIDIKMILAEPVPAALMGRSQMEQVLMNLVVNAKDAMPNGGTLTIETALGSPEVPCALCNVLPLPRKYASLVVRDTGIGVDREILQHIFEPFFTTKPVGQGTGLGLSVVHGIVTQNDGHLTLNSEPGKGTEFRIYFPAVEAERVPEELASKVVPGGTETLLLAENDEEVRGYLVRAMESYGYRVLTAAGADEALALLAGNEVDLLVTDVGLPAVNGVDLAYAARVLSPGLRVLLMSGSLRDVVNDQGRKLAAFVQKPVSPEDLAARVRELLDSRQPRARILVVDDEPGIRSFFRAVLERAGYEIEEAHDGHLALKKIQSWEADLVITDLVMPEKEGLETIQILHREYPAIRILAISGALGGRYLAVAGHLGAHGVLNKPVSPEDLVAKVATLLKVDDQNRKTK